MCLAFSTRNIRISTSDGLLLGAWHILPKSTPRATLEQIHANEPLSPRPRRNSDAKYNQENVVNKRTEAIFEAALQAADKVVLYFHGQVGKNPPSYVANPERRYGTIVHILTTRISYYIIGDRGKSNRIATYKGIQEAIPSAHIISIDCRGYGDSEGFPSEVGFKTDAFAAWQWLTQRVASERVIIYGHSLGSGIATNLCLQLEEHQFAPLAMVLDAAFTSMPDMMTAYRKIPIVRPFARFPFLLNHFKMRLMDRFETVRAVETIKSPLLLIHGQEDADVLISNSHTLFHTALTARRLQSCTKELAVTEAGEAASAEDELARAGLDLSFQGSHSTSRSIAAAAAENQILQRTHASSQRRDGIFPEMSLMSPTLSKESPPTSLGSDSGIGSEAASVGNDAFVTSPRGHLKEPTGDRLQYEHEHEHGHGYGQCHTVQLDFPREGSLEYNQEYQIGFLTVEYAVHNTCMDFEISREVLGSFLRTVDSRRRVQVLADTADASEDKRDQEMDLAKLLCHDKLGFVDQSEVPEVVE